MSSLWTPDGEHPVDPETATPDPAPAAAPDGLDGPDFDDLSPEEQERAREMAREMAEVQEQLASAPAAVVVANHLMGLYELGAIHLSQQPPNFPEASVAIDALGAVIDKLQGRLGEAEPTLRQALEQIRMAFVQLKNQAGADAPADDDGAES